MACSGVIAWEEVGNKEDKVGNTEAKVGSINNEVDNASEGEGIERPRYISGEEMIQHLTKNLSPLLPSL